MAIADLTSRKPESAKKGPDCTVCQALEELPEADAAGLLALLKDKRRRYTEIEALISDDPDTPEWIREIGHRTYSRHANKGCAARVKLR